MLDEENDMAGEGIRRRKKQNKINVKSTGPYRRLEVNECPWDRTKGMPRYKVGASTWSAGLARQYDKE
jgi:hypothetical protein